MSPSIDLSGPRAKLSRALELREELAGYIQRTLEPSGNRPSLALRTDNATKEYVIYVDHVPDLAAFHTRVGLLVGDIVYNLRSALDHLVYQLALINTGGNVARPERTQFPICDSRLLYEKAASADLAEVAPDHKQVIESFQPYHPMEENISVGLYFHPLAMLRDLSNTDKHRFITPVLIPSTGLSLDGPSQWLAEGILTMDFAASMLRGIEPRAEAMVPGLEIARMPSQVDAAAIPPQLVGHSLPVVAFTDGRPVVAVLDKIARAVERVISTFEAPGSGKSESRPAA